MVGRHRIGAVILATAVALPVAARRSMRERTRRVGLSPANEVGADIKKFTRTHPRLVILLS
jgi:hypothetical protein